MSRKSLADLQGPPTGFCSLDLRAFLTSLLKFIFNQLKPLQPKYTLFRGVAFCRLHATVQRAQAPRGGPWLHALKPPVRVMKIMYRRKDYQSHFLAECFCPAFESEGKTPHEALRCGFHAHARSTRPGRDVGYAASARPHWSKITRATTRDPSTTAARSRGRRTRVWLPCSGTGSTGHGLGQGNPELQYRRER